MVQNPRHDRYIVFGIGARTSTGLHADSSAIAVYAGVSGVAEHPYMVDKAGDPFMVGIDPTLMEHNRIERMFILAASALTEVVDQIPLTPETGLMIYLGLPELGMYFDRLQAESLCQRLETYLSAICRPTLVPVIEGNTAAIVAMQQALHEMQKGSLNYCVIGGVDSFLDPDILESMDDAGNVASTSNRWGFPPGEGAAMLAICNSKFAQQKNFLPLAYIVSIGMSYEQNRMGTDTICTGEGLAKAMQEASSAAGGQITKQYCDINGERYREDEFSYAILRVPSFIFVNAVDYVAPADCWGHTGAATGALLALLAIVCCRRGFSVGEWPMIWCGSNNGRRAAMVLHLLEGEIKC